MINQGKKGKETKASTSTRSPKGELPPELDFFKYAQGCSTKRKARDGGDADPKGKKRRVEEDEDEEEEEEEAMEEIADDDPPLPRHRVTTKGNNVPEHAETFQALRERYTISSHLMQNLAQSGYKRPTGVQSYGIPILMEVRTYNLSTPYPKVQCHAGSRPCRHLPNRYR